MKTLLLVGAFIATFFGVFAFISLMVVLVFPVTWYSVVTCPAWILIYLFSGFFLSGAVVDEINNNL